MTYNTFDEVASWYERTPVLRSEKGRLHDVRPIDDRSRPWERIAKLSDSCYALSDGWHQGDLYRPRKWQSPHDAKPEHMKLMCPIVWEKHEDGSTTVKIRNAGPGANSVQMRHSFLDRFLPVGVEIERHMRTGVHHLNVRTGDKRVPVQLPNSKAIPDIPSMAPVLGNRNKVDNDEAGEVVLRFVSRGIWEPVRAEVGRKVRDVDREAKAPYLLAIREFAKWARLMLPMLPLDDYEVSSKARKAFAENGFWSWHHFDEFRAEKIKTVLLDPEHPDRVNLALLLYAEQRTWAEMMNRQIPKNLLGPLDKWCGWTILKTKTDN